MISIKKLFETWLAPNKILKRKRAISSGTMIPTRQMLPFRKNISRIKKMSNSLANMNKTIQR